MKRCSRCNIEKETAAFGKYTRGNDGLQAWCKSCCAEDRRARREADPEKVKAGALASYYKHRDKALASGKVYRDSHKEEERARIKRWEDENPDKVKARHDRYRENSPRKSKQSSLNGIMKIENKSVTVFLPTGRHILTKLKLNNSAVEHVN